MHQILSYAEEKQAKGDLSYLRGSSAQLQDLIYSIAAFLWARKVVLTRSEIRDS